MLFRFTRVWLIAGALLAIWIFSAVRRGGEQTWIRPIGTVRPPVRILQFYASVGILTAGQRALLCYGVENARSITISPSIDGVYPALSRCVEILPQHTTHYVIMAEGYDGRVATQSFTLAVEAAPVLPKALDYAATW
ncbi:MAG TPA: hypothetical protein VME43_28060 [Bryobacteraceae bacterium]|nr:hypothetical protein [Bryobacteraceae bacterium]